MEHKAAQDNQYKAMMAEINDTLSSESDDSTEHEVTHIMTSISSSDQHLGRFAKSIRKAPQKTSTRQHSFSQRKDLPGSLGLRRSKSNKSSTVGFGEDSADDSKDHDDEAFDESSSDSEVDEYHHPGQQQHPDVMLLRESKEALERQHDADVFASLVSDDRESAPGDGSDRRSHQYFRHRHASTSKSSSSPHGRSSRSRSDARIRSSTPSSITSPLHTLGSVDISAMKHFIHTPHRKGERAIRCYVEREKGGGVSAFRPPTYRLFLEEGRQFIMAAKKRSKNKTSNYLISLEKHPRDDRHSSLVVGKVRSNWSGSEYVIFDAGLSPKKTVVKAHGRCILGLVGFRYDKMGPGKLAGCVPRVNEGGVPLTLVDEMVGSGLASKIWDQIDQGVDTEKLMVLRNKRPKFDPKAGGHVLNFHGRVTMSSVKNFQLECDDTHDDAVLQFGRVSCRPPGPTQQCECHADTFNLDFQYPLSPLQAFAFCIASLDKKVADTKGYEAVTNMRDQLKKNIIS